MVTRTAPPRALFVSQNQRGIPEGDSGLSIDPPQSLVRYGAMQRFRRTEWSCDACLILILGYVIIGLIIIELANCHVT